MKASTRLRPAIRLGSAGLLLLLSGVATAGASAESPTLSELFQKGKTEFRIASYRSSLETFAALEQASLQDALLAAAGSGSTTPENELREEIERRIRFAIRGSLRRRKAGATPTAGLCSC